MFGYACRETPELMPAPLYYSHEILRGISKARHSGCGKDPGTGRQEPSDRPLSKRQTGRGDPDRRLAPAPGRSRSPPRMSPTSCAPTSRRRFPRVGSRRRRFGTSTPRGNSSSSRSRDGDCGLTGPKDHRRHLRTESAPHGGGRVFGQGPHEGRSLGGVCGALSGQERGRGGSRPTAARSSFPTPSGWRGPCRSTRTCMRRGASTRRSSRRR